MLHHTSFQCHEQRRMTHSSDTKCWTQVGSSIISNKLEFFFFSLSIRNIDFQRSESGLLQTSKSSVNRLYCHIVKKPPLVERLYLWTQCFIKMALWNSKRPRSDFSLSLFEARTETYLLQSMTNCFCFGKMSKHSAPALWLNMGFWYPLSEQIWTCPYPCPLLISKIYCSQNGKMIK